ncbi:MAG: HEPN domain-containing protein [Promethearchaeia archaeon]
MSKEKVELFFERAENFLKGACERFEDEDWDLTCFLAEQSAQLYLKALILEQTGDFPRIQA